MVSIGIPTIKDNVDAQIEAIKQSTEVEVDVFGTCTKGSAAQNRNLVIERAKYDLIIMCDDDIEGYYFDWVKDMLNIWDDEKMNILSIRPLRKDGSICPLLGDNGSQGLEQGLLFPALHTKATGLNICGSATIMFKKTHVRFDEQAYVAGGCYEDSDFAMSCNKAFPNKKVYITNQVRLIHNMEQKGRGVNREHWVHNRDSFAKKWGITI